MRPSLSFSDEAWPLEMRAETAAAYCDEPSPRAFRSKVAQGLYPGPCRERGCLPKWHRQKLEQCIARRHGIVDAPAFDSDAADLI